jgi:diguanylate cyclase (GGDEF)-like protein
MTIRDLAFGGPSAPLEDDVRRQISAALLDRAAIISSDVAAIVSVTTANELFDQEYCRSIGARLVELLAIAIRDGRLDAYGGFVADLHRAALERGLPTEQLFTFVYLIERTALDELALSDVFGATSEPWPVVAQLVRRSSFDVLASYAVRGQSQSTEAAFVDELTTVYTRSMFEAVLAKEIERAARFGSMVSLILFDVDDLSGINQAFGCGVGDKLLERIGILIRQYFRRHDWVARYSDDSIAVLMTRTGADDVAHLAETLRATVEERLEFTDHRSDRRVRVTVSAAVVNVEIAIGAVVDPQRLMADAEATMATAKQRGRNRVERLDRDSR